jgi:hypothetical protein
MICLAYLSSASRPMPLEAINQILAASRANNARRNVTGMLCHYDGSFLQFLEGDPVQVAETFDVIARDRRHHGLLKVFRREITERLFPDWTMALVSPDEVSPEQRLFCQGLRDVELSASAEHRTSIEPFLNSFRAWIR